MKLNFIEHMNKKVLYTTIALVAILSTLTTVYAVTTLLTIQTTGNLLTDASLSASPVSIAWGDIEKDSITEKTVTITNTGEVATGTLSVTYTLPTGYTLAVSGLPATLNPSASATLTFTLTATASVVADPIFDIQIKEA